MTSIGHIAITSLARNNPIASLIWGFISHWIMDETCSEYKLKSLSAKYLMPYIIWQGTVSIAFLYYTKCWWALLGILPDVIECGYVMIKGIEVWNSGELLFPFHRYRRQKPMWSKKKTLIFEILFVIVALLIFKEVGL